MVAAYEDSHLHFGSISRVLDLFPIKSIAKAVQKAIADLALAHCQSPTSPWVTLSLGIASLVPNGEQTPQDLIDQADVALYAAKEQGRNRYQVFEPSAVAP